MPEPHAFALRRVVLVASALAATFVAHGFAVGGAEILPVAPFVWLGILSLAVVVGPRRRWRPRGALRTLGLTVVLQGAAHLAMGFAPWAVGLAPHHSGHAALEPAQLIPHAVAALVICLFVTRLERWLTRAAAIARRLRRWFATAPRPAPALRPLEADDPRPIRARRAGPSLSRGPPALRPA